LFKSGVFKMQSSGKIDVRPSSKVGQGLLGVVALVLLTACDGTSALLNKTSAETSSEVEAAKTLEAASKEIESATPKPLVWTWEAASIGEWRMGGSSIPEIHWPESGGLGVRAPLEPETPDLHVRSPTVSIRGADYDRIFVDLECVVPAKLNDLSIFYVTSSHAETAEFRARPINNVMMSAGERVVFSYDMTSLLAGGTDWVDSDIQQIRFDFPQGAGSDFVLHSIRLCSSRDPSCK
jgi:hypothetical protein